MDYSAVDAFPAIHDPATAPGDGPPAGQARWASIAASLRSRIATGEFPAGDPLPSEAALASAYGVALGTMRAALQSLVQAGLIERRHGKGTFVRSGIGSGSLSRFFRWGASGELPDARVVSVKEVAAGVEAARALGLGVHAPVLRLVRLRTRAGRPLLHERICLPLERFARLATLAPGEFPPLLYPFYARRCGVTVHRALDDLAFERLAPRIAQSLELPAGHPAIRVTRLAFDLAGRAVEHRITLGNAEDVHDRAEVR